MCGREVGARLGDGNAAIVVGAVGIEEADPAHRPPRPRRRSPLSAVKTLRARCLRSQNRAAVGFGRGFGHAVFVR